MKRHSSASTRKLCFLAASFFMLQLNSSAQDKDKQEKKEGNQYKFGGGPDSTYGKGGRVTIDTGFYKGGSKKINLGYRDGNGKFRQNTEIFHNYEDGTVTTTNEYFDSSGKKTKETSVTVDRIGNETSTREEFYKDGVLDSGDMYYDVEGVREKVHKRYNRDTKHWEFVEKTEGKGNNEEKKVEPDVTSYLFLGGSLINEDNGSTRFNTYGGTVAYNRHINKHIGLEGEIGIYFGSDNNINYTKEEFLAGISFFPMTSDKIFLSPHILAGESHVTSKYGYGMSSNISGSSNSFAAAVGTDFGIPISRKAMINLRADYNPTFSSGGTKSNLWFSAGVNWRL